jgi:hypothetical protein
VEVTAPPLSGVLPCQTSVPPVIGGGGTESRAALNETAGCARVGRRAAQPLCPPSDLKEVAVERHELDIGRLEKHIDTVRERLEVVAQGDDFEELLTIIRKPGWTTPAEFRLVLGIVETIGRQVEAIEHLKRGLLEGSRQVAEGARARV